MGVGDETATSANSAGGEVSVPQRQVEMRDGICSAVRRVYRVALVLTTLIETPQTC